MAKEGFLLGMALTSGGSKLLDIIGPREIYENPQGRFATRGPLYAKTRRILMGKQIPAVVPTVKEAFGHGVRGCAN